MKRILITLLLAIGVLGGSGGYLYYNGIGPFDWLGRLHGQIAPVTIADNTKNYSMIQRAQLEKSGKLPMPISEDELTNWAAHLKTKPMFRPPLATFEWNIWPRKSKNHILKFSSLNSHFLLTQ